MAMGHDLKTQLVLDAMNMALAQRKAANVIHHSDQGSQYSRSPSACAARRPVCARPWARSAMLEPALGLAKPDSGDNAMCESFFATRACELLDRRKFKTKAEARMAIFQFIEGWYNPGRRYSALGYQSPINFERSTREQLKSDSP